MKRVTFEIACELCNIGYPQGESSFKYDTRNNELLETDEVNNSYVDAPYVFEVWQWLRENKQITISVEVETIENVIMAYYDNSIYTCVVGETYEDAINNAIEHIFTNGLYGLAKGI